MGTFLSWWRRRKIVSHLNKTTCQRPRKVLAVERLENRLAPATYQWVGGASGNWTDPNNWSGGPGGTFPGTASDIAQFLDVPAPLPAAVNATVNGPIGVGELDFGTAANVTLAGDGVSGDGFNDGAGLTLSQTGTGSATIAAAISGSGSLTVAGPGGVTISGNNAGFTGTVAILGGSRVKYGTNNALPAGTQIAFGSGTSSSQLDLNGFNAAIGVPTTEGTGTANQIVNSSANPVTLTITGTGATVTDNVAINNATGTGAISLVVTGTGTETFGVANSYTGTTTITGTTVVMGVAGAIPSGQLLVVSSTPLSIGTLDLNSFNLSVAGLYSAVQTSGNITNSSTTQLSTLIINGVSANTFGGSFTGLVNVVNNSLPTANLNLTGLASTFTGGLNLNNGGLVAVNPLSVGTGPITFNTGKLDLSPIPAVVGFGGNGTGWTVNQNGSIIPGPSFIAPDVFEITPDVKTQANSIFYNTQVEAAGGFTASFTYQDTTPGANGGDGFTFCLENETIGPRAVGGGGGALGYDGIKASIAVAFNLYTGNPLGVALGVNGTHGSYNNPGPPFTTIDNGNLINYTISYDGASLGITATDTVTLRSTTTVLTLPNSINSILGGNYCYVGFTGGCGGARAAQTISNFVYQATYDFPNDTTFRSAIDAVTGTTSGLEVGATPVTPSFTLTGPINMPASTTVNIGVNPFRSAANQAYTVTTSGDVKLGGTINIANNGTAAGLLSMTGNVNGATTTGGSMGTLTGNVAFAPSTNFNAVLGGGNAGQYDDLTVKIPGNGTNNIINLNGATLNLTEANLYAPEPGHTFTIINTSGGTLTGQFAQGASITSQGTTYAITYNPNSVVLQVTAVPVPQQLVLISPVIPSTGLSENAAVPFTFSVQVQDASGNPAGGYTGTLSIVDSAGSQSFSPSTLTISNSSVTVAAAAIKAGVNTLTISSIGMGGNGNFGPITPAPTFTLNPGPLAGFNVTPLTTGSLPAGTAFVVEIQEIDPFGNPIYSTTGPAAVNVSISPGTGVVSSFPINGTSIGPTGMALAVGTIDTVGSYTISVADASTGSFKSTAASPVVIVPNTAVKLGFDAKGQPQNTATGDKLPTVKVDILDAFGNIVTGDNTDVVTISVASGPPGPGAPGFLTGSTLMATATSGVATFSNLTLVVPGTYTLGAVVPARYVGPNSNPFSIAPLQVIPGSFSGTASGFSVQFNAPYLVNSTTPLEYGTGFGLLMGQNGQPPTVLLTTDSNLADTNAYVPGTVVLNPATYSLQFIETDTTSAANNGIPLLPDGTYYAVIRGTNSISPNGLPYSGLQALNSGGGFLDGTSSGTPGHDYIATFTVNNTANRADVVWVPATADGPLQTLNAPGNNQQTLLQGGLPIYIDDTTDQVSRVTGTFTYNPTLLTVTGGTSNTSLPGSTFTITVSMPGTATFTYSDSGANKQKLTGGVGSVNAFIPSGSISAPALGFINAKVPNSSTATPIYKAKDVLTLSNLQINSSSATPVVGSSAVHLVAYAGDADGNGSYSAGDAVLTTRVLLSTDSGFTAYPLVDPTIVADTDGSGFVPGDAALQANEASVGSLTANLPIPPIPPGANVTPIGNDAHAAGSTGMIRGHLMLGYDPNKFTILAADVHPGSLLAGGDWSIVPTIDPTASQIVIALSNPGAPGPISSTQAGSLVTIDLHLRPGEPGASATGAVTPPVADAPGLPATIALVSAGAPDGQEVGTELEDGQGSFTLTFAAPDSPAWPKRKV